MDIKETCLRDCRNKPVSDFTTKTSKTFLDANNIEVFKALYNVLTAFELKARSVFVRNGIDEPRDHHDVVG